MTKPKSLLFLALSDSQKSYFDALAIAYQEKYKNNDVLVDVKEVKNISDFALSRLDVDKSTVDTWVNFKLRTIKANRKHANWYKRWLSINWHKKLLHFSVMRFAQAFNTLISNQQYDVLLLLNGAHYKQQAALSLAKNASMQVLYFELGTLPNTTTVDAKGVNFNNSLPRDRLFYDRYIIPNNYTGPKSLIARQPVKAAELNSQLPPKYIFCPFQVHNDTQILLNSPWVRNMFDFYQLIESAIPFLPDNYSFVVKEHPSDKVSYPELHLKNEKIVFANGNDTECLINQSEAVLTVNSTVGIEALMLGTPVITVGDAFYNIDGLVTHCNHQDELNEVISKTNKPSIDADLVNKFIAYLDCEYLVKGKHKNHSSTHIIDMCNKIDSMVNTNET